MGQSWSAPSTFTKMILPPSPETRGGIYNKRAWEFLLLQWALNMYLAVLMPVPLMAYKELVPLPRHSPSGIGFGHSGQTLLGCQRLLGHLWQLGSSTVLLEGFEGGRPF